jgi:hypothetical protein
MIGGLNSLVAQSANIILLQAAAFPAFCCPQTTVQHQPKEELHL